MRILLLEDEPDLGQAIAKGLEREAYVVDWVRSGAIAWELLERGDVTYTVGVLDWLVPEISGVEVCRRVRSRGLGMPILMLTARDREVDRVEGLDAGADDYLVKPFGMAELLARLRALQRRSPQWQPSVLAVGCLSLAPKSYGALGPEGLVELNHKEFQLLELFLRHPRQVLTRDRILEGLWSIDETPGSNVVSVQMRRLRRKLAQVGIPEAITTIYGVGYRLAVEALVGEGPQEG